MKNQTKTNSAIISSIAAKIIEEGLKEDAPILATPSKDRASILLNTYEDIITINEDKVNELLEVLDPKLRSNLLTMIEAIQKFNGQCLLHANELLK